MISQYFYHILCSIGILVAVILGVVVGIILLIICCCCICSNACSACCNCGRAMVKRPKTKKSKQDKKKRKPKHRLMPGVEVSNIICNLLEWCITAMFHCYLTWSILCFSMPLLIGIISAIIIGLLLMVCCCCCLCPSMFLCGCKQCFNCSCCCPSRNTCCCCCHMYTRAGTNDGYYVWFSIDTPVINIFIFF